MHIPKEDGAVTEVLLLAERVQLGQQLPAVTGKFHGTYWPPLAWCPHCFHKAQIMKRKRILVAFLSTRQKERVKQRLFSLHILVVCYDSMVWLQQDYHSELTLLKFSN